MAQDGTPVHGKEQLRAGLEALFSAVPDFKMDLISFFASGDRLCEEWLASGTPAGNLPGLSIQPTGKSFVIRGVTIKDLRDGKICRVYNYMDTASILRQLGILPTP